MPNIVNSIGFLTGSVPLDHIPCLQLSEIGNDTVRIIITWHQSSLGCGTLTTAKDRSRRHCNADPTPAEDDVIDLVIQWYNWLNDGASRCELEIMKDSTCIEVEGDVNSRVLMKILTADWENKLVALYDGPTGVVVSIELDERIHQCISHLESLGCFENSLGLGL